MSKVELNTYGSPAKLKSRLQRLLELSDVKDVQLDTIEFKWSGPDFGWLDLDVLRNGEVVFQVSISWVYSPFYYLIPWLLNLAKQRRPSSILDFDIERYQMQICCDYLGWIKKGDEDIDVALFTLALDWDESEKPAYFILSVHDFIRKLYYGLKDYFMLNKSLFMQEWFDHEYEDNCLELIEADITSSELESLLPRVDETPVIPLPNTDIPLSDEDAFARIDALIASSPSENLSGEEIYRWICANWIFSPNGENEEIKDKRAAWFKVMSGGKYEFDYEWCFDDAGPTVEAFLTRYYQYVDNKSQAGGAED